MISVKSPSFSERVLNSAPQIIFSIILLYAFWAKITLINGLAYTSDLFNAVQSAKSVLQGRPLFFANDLGPASYSHNFFLLILFSPFVWLLGAYSLIIITIILFALAGFLILDHAKHLPLNNSRVLLFATVFTFACGPIAFWLLDDPLYGWHIELLYSPLGLLFVRARCLKLRSSWLWAALIILCKEDGAVVACCLDLAVVSLMAISESGQLLSLLKKENLIHLSKVIALWLIVFIAGMTLLSTLANSDSFRLSGSWRSIFVPFQSPAFGAATIEMLKDTGLLIGASLIILSPLLGVRPLLVVAGTLMPCFLVNYVSAAIYAVDIAAFAAHGITWPARFALIWAIIGGAILCQGMLPINAQIKPTQFFVQKVMLIVFSCWLLQSLSLSHALNYRFMHRLSSPFHRSRDVLLSAKLSSAEQSLVRCLAKLLPTTSAIATEPMLYGYFHNHDVSGADSDGSAWSEPDVIICERRGRLATTDYCSVLLNQVRGHGYEVYRLAGIEVGYKEPFKTLAIACLRRARTIRD